ncbi:hypothetical protein M7I_7674 [Glarea lozoyensis 74030]|nr:hypothetical protein M7I_7674 [Glarea lozoyensis 74030]
MSGVHGGFELQLQNDFCNPMLDDRAYPGLAAGADEWAFQGVDLAFFDSLMGNTGDEGNVVR